MLIPGMVSAREMAMDQFANLLARFVGRSVTNRTMLAGHYDIDLAYTPDQTINYADSALVLQPDGASIFTALQEQLGLKLEPARGPVEILVIDHAERPTEE